MKIEMRRINNERILCVIAYNEGGYNATIVPLEDIVEEVNKSNHPVNLKMEMTN